MSKLNQFGKWNLLKKVVKYSKIRYALIIRNLTTVYFQREILVSKNLVVLLHFYQHNFPQSSISSSILFSLKELTTIYAFDSTTKKRVITNRIYAFCAVTEKLKLWKPYRSSTSSSNLTSEGERNSEKSADKCFCNGLEERKKISGEKFVELRKIYIFIASIPLSIMQKIVSSSLWRWLAISILWKRD